MIEIEKKVRLEPSQLRAIAQRASLIKESHIQDTYFDTADYSYTTQNMWLRKRGEIFELKAGSKKPDGSIDKYEEITDEKSILKCLGIDDKDLPTALLEKGIFSFCSFTTWRKSYQLGELKIDIDEADFGDLKYQIAEIEIMVSDFENAHDAEQKIMHFMKEMNIDSLIPVPAKLTYYLYCKRPEHYRALVENKVIQPLIMDLIQNEKRGTFPL